MSQSSVKIELFFDTELFESGMMDDVKNRFWTELQSIGVRYAQTEGTNYAYIDVGLLKKNDVIEIIKSFPEIIFHLVSSDLIGEVNRAIDDEDYFKAFALCTSV